MARAGTKQKNQTLEDLSGIHKAAILLLALPQGVSTTLLRGLDQHIAEATGLTVNTVDDPLSCVARGTSVYLENLATWKDTMESDADEY